MIGIDSTKYQSLFEVQSKKGLPELPAGLLANSKNLDYGLTAEGVAEADGATLLPFLALESAG